MNKTKNKNKAKNKLANNETIKIGKIQEYKKQIVKIKKSDAKLNKRKTKQQLIGRFEALHGGRKSEREVEAAWERE